MLRKSHFCPRSGSHFCRPLYGQLQKNTYVQNKTILANKFLGFISLLEARHVIVGKQIYHASVEVKTIMEYALQNVTI